jgi:transketolase
MAAPNLQHEINEVKALIMDTVRKANSGHTGGALSSIDFAYLLYKDILRYDPDDPQWLNRDRFVLSAGHESALLYALLYLVGYLELDDLQNFRQLDSRTPGHPESHLTPGVEATTGPLGQGVAMAVGMAVAEEMLRAHLGDDLISHQTYCLCGDGDLQEPVALGAAALAGHWQLGRLIMFYDYNRVQISGRTDRVDSTKINQLFRGFGWHVLEIDGSRHRRRAEQHRSANPDHRQYHHGPRHRHHGRLPGYPRIAPAPGGDRRHQDQTGPRSRSALTALSGDHCRLPPPSGFAP